MVREDAMLAIRASLFFYGMLMHEAQPVDKGCDGLFVLCLKATHPEAKPDSQNKEKKSKAPSRKTTALVRDGFGVTWGRD